LSFWEDVTFLETGRRDATFFLSFCHEGKRKMKGKLGGKGDKFVTERRT
jgi:hypothetical protein